MSAHASDRRRAALPPQLERLRGEVRSRERFIRAAFALPVVAAVALIAERYLGGAAAAAFAAAGLVVAGFIAIRALRRYDARWLLRRLESAQPAFEDSLDLLLGAVPTPAVQGLPALQRARLYSRLQQWVPPDLRPVVPWRALGLTWSGAALVAVVAFGGPGWLAQRHAALGAGPVAPAPVAAPSASLEIETPAYTHLGVQTADSFDATVPEGSRVTFAVRLPASESRPAPAHVALAFLDARRLELEQRDRVWRGARVMSGSALYRLEIDGVPVTPDRLHRLDVVPDRPPEIIVRTPDRTLNLLARDQKSWKLAFEATDDYGIAAAELTIAHAQGSGENIKSTQETLALEGEGDQRHREYLKTLDLAALGFAQGDDLVVRVAVSDNRPGTPNRTQSASFILRWPAQTETAGEGMEGLVQKTLPAYFTSERQLIIDSEALLADRPQTAAERFAARSDELGVEQKTLRLRYGEFLGEEYEPDAEHDADTVPTAKSFGEQGNITAEYGHMHDKPEGATLLDPDTRRLLKGAINEMWQAELHLRQAAPEQALPYEYKALEFIKQVQQAERIYLARAGVQLPQVDPSRRLSGDRTGLADHDLPALPSSGSAQDSPLPGLWAALHAGGAPDWLRFAAWLHEHEALVPDALGLMAAADRVQREPGCANCRADLLGRLWPLLPPAGAALQPRVQPDAAGAAYAQALGSPASPPVQRAPP